MVLILARLTKLEEQGQPLHVWRNNVGGAVDRTGRAISFGEKGASDIMAVARGRFVAIETKSAEARVSKDQLAWGARTERAGGRYVVARSLEEAVEPVLIELGILSNARWDRDHWEIGS